MRLRRDRAGLRGQDGPKDRIGHRLGTRFDVTTSNLELADPRLGRLQFRGRVSQLRRTEREVGLGRRSRARLCEQLLVAREGEPEDLGVDGHVHLERVSQLLGSSDLVKAWVAHEGLGRDR